MPNDAVTTGKSEQSGLQTAVDSIRTWILADRVHVFATLAAAALVLCLFVFLVVPYSFVTVVLAVVLALIAGSAGLAALLTWVAEREGETEGSHLWDEATDHGDRPEEILRGFQPFKEYDDNDSSD